MHAIRGSHIDHTRFVAVVGEIPVIDRAGGDVGLLIVTLRNFFSDDSSQTRHVEIEGTPLRPLPEVERDSQEDVQEVRHQEAAQ